MNKQQNIGFIGLGVMGEAHVPESFNQVRP